MTACPLYRNPWHFSGLAGFDPTRFFGTAFSYEIVLFFVLPSPYEGGEWEKLND